MNTNSDTETFFDKKINIYQKEEPLQKKAEGGIRMKKGLKKES